MLKARILQTIKFFDLQDYPLTLLELDRFLIADLAGVNLDSQGEILKQDPASAAKKIRLSEILACIENECGAEVGSCFGFYFLSGRKDIAELRLQNYFFGIEREKLVKKYIKFLKYIPFVRGVALAGSQAMGLQKQASDIDLLIITDSRFMWLARTAVTFYFQVLGKRRHGLKIRNRFCLNHYLAGIKKITRLRNLYTAHEYLKLRPLVFGYNIWQFQALNPWMFSVFPNADLVKPDSDRLPALQEGLEKMLSGPVGRWLENSLKNWQLPKIRQEKFILVSEDELSFHPDSKQESLLDEFLHPYQI